MLVLLVLSAAALRVVYYRQLAGGPWLELHRLEQTDMHYYETWGRRIAAGDWASAAIALPMHGWHRDLGDEREWTLWLRRGQFYQDPLYSYLIGATYRLTGADVRYVFLWQMVLGVLTVVLVWALARRFFGDTVGATAAVLALLCAPLVYYELVLLRESIIAFAGLFVVWLMDRAFVQGTPGRFAALGAGLGFALLLKSTFAVLLVAAAAALLFAYRRRRRAGVGPALSMAAGLAVPLGLLAARNVAVGVPPFALASAGPLTFALSNGPGFAPHLGFAVDKPFVSRVMREAEGRAWPVVRATLGAHTPRSYASLVWRKWFHTWHAHEIPNNESFDYMRRQAPLLRGLPLTFAVISPLALVGLLIAVRRAAVAWPLYLLVVASLVPLVVFYVLGRFRTGLLAAVLPFAALAIVQVGRWLAARRYGAAAAATAATVALGFWTAQPPAAGQIGIRADDWMIPYLLVHEPRVREALGIGDVAAAAAAYQDFFTRYEPDEGQLRATGSPRLASALARMHEHCGALLADAGRVAEAEKQEAHAQRLHLLAALLPPS